MSDDHEDDAALERWLENRRAKRERAVLWRGFCFGVLATGFLMAVVKLIGEAGQ